MSFYPQQQQSLSQMVPSVALRKYLRKLSTSSSNDNTRKLDTNLNKKLMTELQLLIAFASYALSAIAGAGVSMTESMIEQMMVQLCFLAMTNQMMKFSFMLINSYVD
jgi:hypothetical protein